MSRALLLSSTVRLRGRADGRAIRIGSDRMKLYNKIDAQIVEHKGELVEVSPSSRVVFLFTSFFPSSTPLRSGFALIVRSLASLPLPPECNHP